MWRSKFLERAQELNEPKDWYLSVQTEDDFGALIKRMKDEKYTTN